MYGKGSPEEYPIALFVNDYKIAIFQLTNMDLEDWAYGYLFGEGLIQNAKDIEDIQIGNGKVRVKLRNDIRIKEFSNKEKYITAGCGNGVTFFSMSDVKRFKKVKSKTTYKLSYLLKKRSEFTQNSPLYIETGGMHGACIVNGVGELIVREDIGRHNAVDKVIGYAVKNELNTDSLLLITTGRISYEMLSKAAKYGFSVVGSRTAATKQAIQLANYLNIEVVGYLRGKGAVTYTSQGRIINDMSDFQMEAN